MPVAQPCRSIVLVGFMGAGKSTVARILANALGWKLIDLDESIEQHCGMPVPQIFDVHGEDHFRDIEELALQNAVRLTDCVIAAGGGAVESSVNRQTLQSTPGLRTFYLEAPLPELLSRCARQPHARPLLADAELLLGRRADLYAAIGTPVSTFGFSAEQVAEHILSLLQMDNALAP